MAAVAHPVSDTTPPPSPATVSVVVRASGIVRWDDLVRAIDALRHQSRRPDQVVIVVDHDDDLLQRAADHYASVPGTLAIDVVASTGRRGVSGARNTGISWCTGDVIAFLDDEVCPSDGYWIATLVEDYDRDCVAGVGGGATPDWNDSMPPRWFPSEFGWVVGCSHPGLPRDVSDVGSLLGVNMSFRREVFDGLGVFGDGEESEYCDRLRQRFPVARLVFDPDLDVIHRIAPHQLSFGNFVRRCWAEGLSGGEAAVPSTTRRALPRSALVALGAGLRGRIDGFSRAAAIMVGLAGLVAGAVCHSVIRMVRH